jgi:ribosomal protein RSM22 (predicted rRNA methylase)
MGSKGSGGSKKRSLESNAWCHFVQRTPLPLRKPGHSHEFSDPSSGQEGKPKARGRHAGKARNTVPQFKKQQRPYHEERFSYVALYKERPSDTQQAAGEVSRVSTADVTAGQDHGAEGGGREEAEEGEEGEEDDAWIPHEGWSRVIRAPLRRKGHISVDVCCSVPAKDGEGAELKRMVLSKGKLNKTLPGSYRVARKLPWGGVWPSPWPPESEEQPAESKGRE